ncbi:hypothetical protein ElyMa_003757100 [Elysia marginata]|uniref:Uncharacterized protein n=1 Tax=Elysia marginata TaxID=1093978 RepID=A0AAV4F8S3_9GAST|nr:hypothetical protein ElyMa_003757100 [Elysia marginata]
MLLGRETIAGSLKRFQHVYLIDTPSWRNICASCLSTRCLIVPLFPGCPQGPDTQQDITVTTGGTHHHAGLRQSLVVSTVVVITGQAVRPGGDGFGQSKVIILTAKSGNARSRQSNHSKSGVKRVVI